MGVANPSASVPPGTAPAAPPTVNAVSEPVLVVVHAEVDTALEVAPWDVRAAVEVDRARRWVHDLIVLLRRHQRDACHRATDAARTLLDKRASPEEQARAQAAMEEFIVEDLRFRDDTVRRNFAYRLLERIDPFMGLPFWTALIGELRSRRWMRCESDWPLLYVRRAMYAEAHRHYVARAQELRQRDNADLPVEALEWKALPAWERIAAEPELLNAKRHPRTHLRPSGPIHKVEVPKQIGQLVVELDTAAVLRKVGVPERVRELIEWRVMDGGADVDIAAALGWSAAQLEAAQTAWRETWSSPVRNLCTAGTYSPTLPVGAWNKHQKARAARSAKSPDVAPYVDGRRAS
jgi:hypothetical protein